MRARSANRWIRERVHIALQALDMDGKDWRNREANRTN